MSSTVAPAVIGRFGKAFGVKGWIKVISFTTPKENILKFKPWLIQKNNDWLEVYLENSKIHADHIVVKLPGYESPEEASFLTNNKIAVWREQLPKLTEGEYYWTDLYGLEIVNKEGMTLGVVKEIVATGANDVLVVVGERKYLIPYISNTVIDVDLSNKIIHVDWEKDFS